MSKSNYDYARENADELLQYLIHSINSRNVTYDDLFGSCPNEILYEMYIKKIIHAFSYYDRSVLNDT